MAERSAPIRMSAEALADVTYQFTQVLYVDPSIGSDSYSGESWEFPFRTLWAAIGAAGSGDADITLIVLSPDDHNVDQATPTVDKQVVIRGALYSLSSIYNDAVGATEILKFTNNFGLERVEVYLSGPQNGIVISGAGAYYSYLKDVDIDCRSATGAHDGVLIEQVSEVHLNHLHIMGDVALTTAIHLDEAISCHIHDMELTTALIGIHVENASSDRNHFFDLAIISCATGIQIDAGSGNYIEILHIQDNTTNIDDNGTDTHFSKIHYHPNAALAPDNLVGVVVTAGAAGVWGVVSELRAAAAATKPFYITGITYELNQQERYQLRMSADGGTTYFYSLILEERDANRTKYLVFGDRFFIHQGSAITAYVRSETGGNTCTVWLHIDEI